MSSCERMFLYCKWKGKQVDCKHYVRQMKTDTGFCCSINAINLAENYIVPEDDKDNVNNNYNGCPYYTTASFYSTTPSYSYYGTSTPPCESNVIQDIQLYLLLIKAGKRRKRSHASNQTTQGPYTDSTSGYEYYEYTSPSSYYDCYNSYDPPDDTSVIQR